MTFCSYFIVSKSQVGIVCPLCPYEETAILNMKMNDYLTHVKECHGYSPNFHITCGVHGCPRIFKKFSTFKKHIYEYHSQDLKRGTGTRAN